MIHIYTGPGKGKTSSSIGLAVRALGHNKKVAILQFMKNSYSGGEYLALSKFRPELEFKQYGSGCSKGFDSISNRDFNYCKSCRKCYEVDSSNSDAVHIGMTYASNIIANKSYDVVILDEILFACSIHLVSHTMIRKLAADATLNEIELVLTGRDCPKDLYHIGDCIVEMNDIKHPFSTKGIYARKGVDF